MRIAFTPYLSDVKKLFFTHEKKILKLEKLDKSLFQWLINYLFSNSNVNAYEEIYESEEISFTQDESKDRPVFPGAINYQLCVSGE